ncbi:hypothetical protein [Nonlabens marinus]|uniref:Uncharacterized protein n=1 Tax=Nonlabens marinus S1-08 TaxID=1454201 RepID=W8VZQ9_9FLAO|nr:hypothetical protein [Nonlabens marinus]BAO55006.1 hypothetical protein NMS_0997 [Nonlabens marinus S1-08]
MILPFSEFSNAQKYDSLVASFLKNDTQNRYKEFNGTEYSLDALIERSLLDDTGEVIYDEITLRETIVRFIDSERASGEFYFFEQIKSNLNYTAENISHLANNMISHLQDIIYNADSLFKKDELLTNQLTSAISSLNDVLSEYVKNPYPKNLMKMDFNLNRSTLTYLFCVLRERNILRRSISNAELARFLQFTTTYLNDEGSYSDVKGVASLISDFGSKHGEKSQVNAANELEDLFQNDDFFMF